MHSRSSHWLSVMAVLVCVPLIGLVALRVLGLENNMYVVSAEVVYPYLLLPAYVVVLAALVGRWYKTLVLGLVVVLCHLSWTLPMFFGSQDLTAAQSTAPSFRLFSHNVKFDGATPERLGDAIKQANADVVFLQELTWQNWQTIKASGALDPYPYSKVAQAGTDGLGLWSKFPLRSAELVASPGFPYIRAVTDVRGADVALYDVHTRAPVNGGDISYWLGDLAQLRTAMSNETLPTIAAGDFNATYQHRPFRALLDSGFHDAVVADGRGYARTWPLDRVGGGLFSGYIRLDHVLVSNAVGVKETGEMEGGGSDHKAIYADLVIAPD